MTIFSVDLFLIYKVYLGLTRDKLKSKSTGIIRKKPAGKAGFFV